MPPVSTERFRDVERLIAAAVAARIAPAIAIEVGDRHRVLWQAATGTLTYDTGALPCTSDTVFDLASLTKVIATASLAMRATDEDAGFLATPVASFDQRWRGNDRSTVTVGHLLDHSSGLPAHVKLYETASGRDAFRERIMREPLVYAPGTASQYSDLGFILLGLLIEDQLRAPIDDLFRPIADRLTTAMTFNPPADDRRATAPTEIDSWRGRLLQGEVHDENTAAIGGAAGHAGLFGTARDVGRFAQLVLRTCREDTWLARQRTIQMFATRSSVPGSSRALAWDTMLPTSSCGTRMSASAIGHTGFTGTSLWIDPARDVYVVLLTNRVHPSRDGEGIQPLRRAVHDAVMMAVEL